MSEKGVTDFTPRGGRLGGSQFTMKEMRQSIKGQQPTEGMRPQTLEGLKAIADANKAPVAKDVAEPVDGPVEQTPEQSEIKTESVGIPGAPGLDSDALSAMLSPNNPFATPERKKAIESRCDDLSFDGLLSEGEITQKVPIRPGQLEATYRSHSTAEEMFVKGEIYDVAKKGISVDHVQSLVSIYNLVLDLVAINSSKLPLHLDAKGQVDKELFTAKLAVILKMPAIVVGDLSTNLAWFQERLQKLITVDSIKNG